MRMLLLELTGCWALPFLSLLLHVDGAVLLRGGGLQPLHVTCKQPTIGGQNLSFWTGAAFAAPGNGPQVLLSMASVGPLHVPPVLGLSVIRGGNSCRWFVGVGSLSEPRTSGCATAYGQRIAFAGGHNNSAAYVGTVDVYERTHAGAVSRVRTLQLPVGRELLGCATASNISVFAGGKPPHCSSSPCPPGISRIGETKEIDVWNHAHDSWLPRMNLSVERKKVEALAVGDYILMAGGEIGHHPPADEFDARAASYSSTVDILDVRTMKLSVSALSWPRQYFAVAAAGGKAFFAGGFGPTGGPASRFSLVDIWDSKTQRWSTAHLSTNRSNLMGVSVADRWVLFGGGTRIPAPEPDVCNTTERSAVVDIHDTLHGTWTTECLAVGHTSTAIATGISTGRTAIFFGGGTVDLFTFEHSH